MADPPSPQATGKSPHPCSALKLLTNKMGGMFCHRKTKTDKYKRLDAKLERKMIDYRRGASGNSNFRSINSIIMRFPQLKAELKNLQAVYEQYDEDATRTIDCEGLKKCLEKLQVQLTDDDIDDLFHSCDVDESGGIQFNEFVVFLCLVYLLMKPSSSFDNHPRMGSPQLEATFETILEAFSFMDKNGDGKLNKSDMIKAFFGIPCEKSSPQVTMTRFREMDRDKNGSVGFREFLFALVNWLGIDHEEEIPVAGE